MENEIKEINGLISQLSSNFGHDLEICADNLNTIHEQCVLVNSEASNTASLLHEVNKAKIKNSTIFLEVQSEDSNK